MQVTYPRKRAVTQVIVVLGFVSLMACYSHRWSDPLPHQNLSPAPDYIQAIFTQAGGALELVMTSPGNEYAYDPAEKDQAHGQDENALRFRQGTMRLRPEMPPGQIQVELAFTDGQGNRVTAGPVDLMRIVPRIDAADSQMQLVEMLQEEFTRIGVTFRREHGEFNVETSQDAATAAVLDKAYRLNLINNCLDPTKWEFTLNTEDYRDFNQRLKSHTSLNQSRVLTHSWFRVDESLYFAMIAYKNPELQVNVKVAQDYEGLTLEGEKIKIDYDQLRKIRKQVPIEVVELAHQSGRRLTPPGKEQFYKWDYGLFINRDQFETYADLQQADKVKLAQYSGDGFYFDQGQIKEFNYGWLQKADRITLNQVAQKDSECFVEVVIESDKYTLTLGNLDLSLLDEQKFIVYPFGYNPYPLSRRHNPSQSTRYFEVQEIPHTKKPYMFMTRTDGGTWVNNYETGLERVYLGWESIEKNTLAIYLLSYERITPTWMARIQLDDELVDRVRTRRILF